jgi:chitin disaccharide deacetylase
VPSLIVNADDFGLTAGVNRAILELHTARVLTSTTLMAHAGATDEAIEIARATPALGVGCHIVLTDGEPVLPPGKVPSLVERRTGQFLPTLSAFLRRLFCGQIRAEEIEAEAAAQIALLETRGVRLTHIDSHKHTHMFPGVLRPLLRAAGAAGIRAIRNPFEPAWAVRVARKTALVRAAEVSALRWLAPICLRLITEAGFATTDGTIAVASTGNFNADVVRTLIASMPEGTWELVTHPGYNDADLARVRTRLRASRDVEREALPTLREYPGVELISFAGLHI